MATRLDAIADLPAPGLPLIHRTFGVDSESGARVELVVKNNGNDHVQHFLENAARDHAYIITPNSVYRHP